MNFTSAINTSSPSAQGLHFNEGSRGTGATWTSFTTFSADGQPRNRKERREKEKNSSGTSQVRVKVYKEEDAHQRHVNRIKSDLASKGVTLPDQMDTTEPAPTFASWATQSLRTGIEWSIQTCRMLQDAVRWVPGPAVVGATSTCDVNGQCNDEALTDVPPISIADFRKWAKADFSITMSDSLKTRKDRTLRGVVVLIGERDHDDPNDERSPSRLVVQNSIRPGDVLLVEQPPIEGWIDACKGVVDLGAKCYPADISEARAELDKAEDEMKRDLACVTRAAMKAMDLGFQPMSFIENMESLNRDELAGLMLDYLKRLRAAGGESLFSPEGWRHFVTLHEASMAAAEKLKVTIVETSPAREEGFGGELERHSAAAPDRAIFGVWGDTHVQNMEAWVLERWDAIVLHPKHQ